MYSIVKAVQGTFNQGHPMFGITAGRQCSCCSLISICFSTVKTLGQWNQEDLDFIVRQGDAIYKLQNTESYLMATELPRVVNFYGSELMINFLDTTSGLLYRGDSSSFLTSSQCDGNGLIFFIKGYCVSVLWTKKFVFLFDSHSKDCYGQTTLDGFSTLLKFKSKKDLEQYIVSTYINETDVHVRYETQAISVNISNQVNLKREYYKEQDRKRKATEYQKAKCREKNATETRKAKCRERNATETQKAKCRERNSTETQKAKCRERNATETQKAKCRERNATETQKAKCRERNATEIQIVKGRKRKATESAKTKNRAGKRSTYKTFIGSEKHNSKKRNMQERYKNKRIVDCVTVFKEEITNGPYYICVVCNRCLYRKTVKIYVETLYKQELVKNVVTYVKLFDAKLYICFTCDKSLKKGAIPCEAVWNKLQVFPLPQEIEKLNRLERVLISKRILFKKISIMPKGQQQKIKGAICNIPVNSNAMNNVLPQAMDSNGLIFVKLKKKLIFSGHVLFENVRPDFVKDALEYLKSVNPFYSKVLINMDNISKELLSLADIDAIIDHDSFPIANDNSSNDDSDVEGENPLNAERAGSDEICLIPNIYNSDQGVLDIAPGEGKQPFSFFTDQFCEELAFPFLFPNGKFGYKVNRSVTVTPTKYFNQRLLNYTQRFSSCADYIFFAHYVTQQINLFNQMNVATRKVQGQLTAGQLNNDYKETVKSFISEDQGYQFMNSVKGTPAYWKHFLCDVLAMVKQLGLPTYFLTLSCADLRWNELLTIIAKLNNVELSEEDYDYIRKCNFLNQNPVFTAKHFQYRVEVFFKEIILGKGGPLGPVKYYVIKVEFQFRGSPHIHSFLWVVNAPVLSKENKEEYIKFIDKLIRTDLPDPNEEPGLHKLVSDFQIHSHSNSCRKYKNIPCRFHFGRFFTNQIIVAEPLSENLSEMTRNRILKSRSKVLKKVKEYIDDNLDPHKATYKDPKGIPDILQKLNLSPDQYYEALSISSDQDFEVHFRRPPNSCFVNNYFAKGLLAWQANMDIQPVFNYYKAVSYMCSYFSKSESESSLAMQKAAEETRNSKLDFKERMKKLAVAFLSNRQCSLQEAVYQVMPELWLRKCFPRIVFANSNLPEKRYRICKSKEELAELPESSTEVFKRNSLDRYLDRPNLTFKEGKYSVLDNFCFADFVAYYVLNTKPKVELENDNQPEVLLEDDIDTPCSYPRSIPLMSSKEKMRCRSVKLVVRYHTPNPATNAEAYAHHLLMMFYPF